MKKIGNVDRAATENVCKDRPVRTADVNSLGRFVLGGTRANLQKIDSHQRIGARAPAPRRLFFEHVACQTGKIGSDVLLYFSKMVISSNMTIRIDSRNVNDGQ
ncbi:MAG: hypothetical protein PGN21_15795 [Sphingomonas paucimobilis]